MLTSVVVFTDVAVVVVTIPYINAVRLSLVVIKWTQALVPSAPDCCLFRLVPAALKLVQQLKLPLDYHMWHFFIEIEQDCIYGERGSVEFNPLHQLANSPK